MVSRQWGVSRESPVEIASNFHRRPKSAPNSHPPHSRLPIAVPPPDCRSRPPIAGCRLPIAVPPPPQLATTP